MIIWMIRIQMRTNRPKQRTNMISTDNNGDESMDMMSHYEPSYHEFGMIASLRRGHMNYGYRTICTCKHSYIIPETVSTKCKEYLYYYFDSKVLLAIF